MTAEDEQQVLSREELSVGDEIEAWHNGKLFHRGEVIRTVADTDLFWILDERTGIRRLIDAEALVIRRMAVTAVKYGSVAEVASAGAGGVSGRPAAESLATVVPASHLPLFQAPSVVP